MRLLPRTLLQRTEHLSVPGHLFAAKLTALARNITDVPLVACEAPGQAGAMAGDVGFVLAEGEGALSTLGPALRWGGSQDLTVLHVLAQESAGQLARRVGWFDKPGVDLVVWQIVGTELKPVEPEPFLEVPELGPDVWALAGLMTESGARPVDDHGRLVAEFAGLEIARVEQDEAGEILLEVGVGQADRELHHYVHSNLDTDAALKRAVAMVATHRSPGAPFHPLNRLAPERWLRSLLLEQPSLVGAESLEPVPPLRPRSTLLGTQPSAAVGVRSGGKPVVVVTSVGVDPDLIPEAADYRGRFDDQADLVVVVPPRDRYQLTMDLVEALGRCELVGLDPPWG